MAARDSGTGVGGSRTPASGYREREGLLLCTAHLALSPLLSAAAPEHLEQRKELREKIQSSVGKVGALVTKKSLDPETLKKIREEVYGIVDTSA